MSKLEGEVAIHKRVWSAWIILRHTRYSQTAVINIAKKNTLILLYYVRFLLFLLYLRSFGDNNKYLPYYYNYFPTRSDAI